MESFFYTSLTTILCLLYSTVSVDIQWFKETSFHQNNIQQLVTGWAECPDWKAQSTETLVSISTMQFTTKIQIPPVNNSRYNITALCVTIQVPINWDQNNMTVGNETSIKTIDYNIARLFSVFNPNNTDGKGAFWMLAGGPGGAGSNLYAVGVPLINFLDDKFEVYIPDHRGTGYSHPLICRSGIPTTCMKKLNISMGNNLHYFSTYSAGMDLGYAVHLFQSNLSVYNATNHFVYGISYGTYYLNQYLILFPNQFNAAIFDGTFASDSAFTSFDNDMNKIGLEFMSRCDDDLFCSKMFAELNTTMLNATDRIFNILHGNINETSECLRAFNMDTASNFRSYLAQNLQSVDFRVLLPPMIYRIHRCNADDIVRLAWLGYISNEIFNLNVTKQFSNSTQSLGLMLNIVLSEMWSGANYSNPGPSYQELLDTQKQYYFSLNTGPWMRSAWDIWNKYQPNKLVFHRFANPSIPLLFLHGDLDPQTAPGQALHAANIFKANINNNTPNVDNRYFMMVPNAPHVVLLTSLLRNYTDTTLQVDHDFETCGMYMIKSFIDPNNNYVPNMDCMGWLQDIDWNVTSNVSQQLAKILFATSDVWDIQSVAPTPFPSKVNETVAPTTFPTNSPSILPTDSPTHETIDTNNVWYIIGIVFICLFGISLLVICYLMFVIYTKPTKVKDARGKYSKANDNIDNVEVGTLKNTVAEESD